MIFTKTGLNGNVRSDVPIPRSYRADYAINGEPLAGDREFESFSLQRRVHVSRDFVLHGEKPAFRAGVRARQVQRDFERAQAMLDWAGLNAKSRSP